MNAALKMDLRFLPQLHYLSPYYSECFASYRRHTNEHEKMLEWISDRFDEEISSKLVKRDNEDGIVTLSVLGIGSGDGKLDVKMLIQLKKKFRTIECTVVEPSAERITSYKQLVQEQKDALDGVTFDWRQATLQEFCNINSDRSTKFHFVCAMHSLYYIPRKDFDYYMNTLFEWTEGTILMMHDTDMECFGLLQKEFVKSLNFNRGNNIADSLKKLGIPFETTYLSSECDVTSIFQSDSQDGKLLLDFLLHRVKCKDDGPPELLKTIKEFLNCECNSYTRNGRVYVPIPTQITITSSSKGSNK